MPYLQFEVPQKSQVKCPLESSWVQECMISVPGRQRQLEHELEASLGQGDLLPKLNKKERNKIHLFVFLYLLLNISKCLKMVCFCCFYFQGVCVCACTHRPAYGHQSSFSCLQNKSSYPLSYSLPTRFLVLYFPCTMRIILPIFIKTLEPLQLVFALIFHRQKIL